MLKNIYNLSTIADIIKAQTTREVISISSLRNYEDCQEFLVLEWMNEHEYVVRRWYRFLAEEQPMSGGSGYYLCLYDKHKDGIDADRQFQELKEVFNK